MGTLYYVACRDCKVTRELDKFYDLTPVENKKEAIELSERLDTYRASLLVSFMAEHSGHNCTVFSEHSEKLVNELDPDFNDEMKLDGNYW